MLKLLVVVASLFIGGGMAMGEPGGADGFSAVAAVDPGAKPEAQLDGEPQEVSEAPAYRVDDLTFLYLTHEVYLEPYVSCRPKVLGERSYVACWNETYSGRSPLNFWEYDGGDFLAPVSYTHLRAHETGRNLVCRLLLEKKKTTKFKSNMNLERYEKKSRRR